MGGAVSSALSPRHVVEKMAFHYLAGQHEMSVMANDTRTIPATVRAVRIGKQDTYCLYQPPVASLAAEHEQQESSSPECIFLCFHGNAESVYGLWDDVVRFIAAPLPQCAFFAVEYPGYVCEELTPQSKYWESATPTEDDIKQHAAAVYDRVHTMWPNVPIICVGRSLGCGVALWLASTRTVHAVLLLAPYLSIMRVGIGMSIPYMDIFDNLYIAPSCRAQNVVIVHSKDDPVIPIGHSEQLIQQLHQCAYTKLIRRNTSGHGAKYLRNPTFVEHLLEHLGVKVSSSE